MNKLEFKAFNTPKKPGLYAFATSENGIPDFAPIELDEEGSLVVLTKNGVCPLSRFGLPFWTDEIERSIVI